MSDGPRAIEGAPFAEGPRIPGRAPAGEPEAAQPAREGRPAALPAPEPLRHEQPGSNGASQTAVNGATTAPAPNAATRSVPASSVRSRDAALDQAEQRRPSPARPADPDEVKIGLWGSTASGKTTFLAALRHAMGSASGMGRWTVIPGNDISEKMLVDLTHTLVMRQEFPQATPLASQVELLWHFIGQFGHRAAGSRRRWRSRPSPDNTSKFLLNLIDVSGEAFRDQSEASIEATKAALNHLAASQGLLYLFDPLGEEERHNSIEYLNNTIVNLHARMHRENRLVGPYLPQQISVCMTKFDHPRFFQQARKARLVNSGPDDMPRILDQDAETLFNMICDGKFWGPGDERSRASAQFIRNEIVARFHPDRIRYFVSSSIGFFKPPGWDPATGDFGVDSDNFANVRMVGDKLEIRGAISPINVLEPLISLQQRLSGAARTRG